MDSFPACDPVAVSFFISTLLAPAEILSGFCSKTVHAHTPHALGQLILAVKCFVLVQAKMHESKERVTSKQFLWRYHARKICTTDIPNVTPHQSWHHCGSRHTEESGYGLIANTMH